MSASSSRDPQLPQSHQSHSPSPYRLPARNDTEATLSPAPRPSDKHCMPGQDVLATSTSRAPAPNSLTHPQNSTDRLGGYKPLGDIYGQLSRALQQRVAPFNVINSTFLPQPELSPQDPAARAPAHLEHLPVTTNSNRSQHPSWVLPAPPQQSLGSERQSQLAGGDLLPPRGQTQGMFNHAHNFRATESTFIDSSIGNVTNNFNNSTNFMEKLLKETIPGAAADSSARDPPPRCHPGTRLAVLERCLHFIVHCYGVQKMRWIVGLAGVGKSAIMQSVAESRDLVVSSKASVFFSINGRDDTTKAFVTISYQLAVKSEAYRRVIENEITRDPSLLQSSMQVQFEKFIVEPFTCNPDLNSAGRVLIIIDGLDECSNAHTQVELLRLIFRFCISYPSSPIAWLIACRPESHITSFFSRNEVIPAYEKEEISVNSDEARADVERFLRHKLTDIAITSDFLDPQWPDERDFWKLAEAAGGLFAYAQTVVRYIGDEDMGDPALQLSDVLNVIDELPMLDVPADRHPMALLYALYARILSRVPPRTMANTRKLLLLLVSNWDFALPSYSTTFIVMCNWLGMTADEGYAALNRLRSVFDFPLRHEAHKKALKAYHKSFIDYLPRSGLFPNIEHEARQIKSQCTFRVLEEAPSGTDFGNGDSTFEYGLLVSKSDTGGKISTTWRADDGMRGWDDDQTRLSMYQLSMGEVAAGMKRGDSVFQSKLCIKLLTTQFRQYDVKIFPYLELCNLVFDKSRCHEFMECGILKKIPAKAVDMSKIRPFFNIKLQFHRPAAMSPLPDGLSSFCEHERVGQWKEGEEHSWVTVFSEDRCSFCVERLERQWSTWHQDQAVLIMFATAKECCVEVWLVDPEDKLSEWTYWVWLSNPRELKGLASAV